MDLKNLLIFLSTLCYNIVLPSFKKRRVSATRVLYLCTALCHKALLNPLMGHPTAINIPRGGDSLRSQTSWGLVLALPPISWVTLPQGLHLQNRTILPISQDSVKFQSIESKLNCTWHIVSVQTFFSFILQKVRVLRKIAFPLGRIKPVDVLCFFLRLWGVARHVSIVTHSAHSGPYFFFCPPLLPGFSLTSALHNPAKVIRSSPSFHPPLLSSLQTLTWFAHAHPSALCVDVNASKNA